MLSQWLVVHSLIILVGTDDILKAERANIDGTEQRVDEARESLSGWLYVSDYASLDPAFVLAVKESSESDFGVFSAPGTAMHTSAAMLYDAVILFARACSTLTLAECQTNATAVLEKMKVTTFVGESGFLRLDENEDRIPASIGVYNYVKESWNMRNDVIAIYEHEGERFERTNLSVIWPGNVSALPADMESLAQIVLLLPMSGVAQSMPSPTSQSSSPKQQSLPPPLHHTHAAF